MFLIPLWEKYKCNHLYSTRMSACLHALDLQVLFRDLTDQGQLGFIFPPSDRTLGIYLLSQFITYFASIISSIISYYADCSEVLKYQGVKKKSHFSYLDSPADS